MPNLGPIIDMREDTRAQMQIAQSIGRRFESGFARRRIEKEKHKAKLRDGILNQNILYASKNKLGPDEALDLFLKTDEFAESAITQNAVREAQRQIMGGYRQSPEQENQLLNQLGKYENLLKNTIDDITGKPIAGREKEFEFYDKKVNEIIGRLQYGGGQQMQGGGQNQPMGEMGGIEQALGSYMQQTPEHRELPTISESQPTSDIAKIISQAENYMKNPTGRRDPMEVKKAQDLYARQQIGLNIPQQQKTLPEQQTTPEQKPSRRSRQEQYQAAHDKYAEQLLMLGDVDRLSQHLNIEIDPEDKKILKHLANIGDQERLMQALSMLREKHGTAK